VGVGPDLPVNDLANIPEKGRFVASQIEPSGAKCNNYQEAKATQNPDSI
jgi:hypothetical protein